MLKSFLTLSLIALQVVVAQTIEKGIYLIEDTSSGRFLGIPRTPNVYPPPDVSVLLVPRDDRYVVVWRVEEGKDNTVIISARPGAPKDYKIMSKGDFIFVSAEQEPEQWAVQSTGQGEVEIKLPYGNKVFTSNPNKSPAITLQPAQGLPNQQYRFVRVDRKLYHGNRFYNQESC